MYYCTIKDGSEYLAAEVTPLKSKTPKTLTEIHSHMEKWYAGNGILYLTNVQKISEEDFDEYGKHYEIE